MKINPFISHPRFLFAADHGGQSVKGGGPESDPTGDGAEQIADALGQPESGHRPLSAFPGVPGSRTNPVHGDPEPETDAEGAPSQGGNAVRLDAHSEIAEGSRPD
jgi:hypothetical protein